MSWTILYKRGHLLILVCFLWVVGCKDDQVIPAGPSAAELTEEEEELVEELKAAVTPLPQSPFDIDDKGMHWLDVVAQARMVGLGEATHGTREFFQMKDRAFRYLVEKHNFQAFGFEADYAESIFINKYIQTGVGNIELIMKNRMHFWTWRTEEVRELYEWMLEYNSVPERTQIQYFGYDCQAYKWQPVLLELYLQPLDEELQQRIERVLYEIEQADDVSYYNTSQAQVDAWKDSLDILEQAFEEKRDEFTPVTGVFDFEVHKHLLTNVKQVLQVGYAIAISDNSVNYRDKYMAENALWFADMMGEGVKVCVWAHNAHVARNPLYGGGGAMGYRLKQALGPEYQVVAFGFTKGYFTAVTQRGGSFQGLEEQYISDEPRRLSLNFLFKEVDQPAFALDLDALSGSADWRKKLEYRETFLEIGSVFNGNPPSYYRQVEMSRFYDVLVYYGFTAAAEQLP